MSEPSFTCPRCGAVSYNANDVREGYCGRCRDWTGAIKALRAPDIMLGENYFDRQSNAVTFARWCWLMEYGGLEYKVVARTDVELYTVSTVWLGLNHQWDAALPPLIFETMTFLSGTPEDMYMRRYITEDQALAGHEATVAEIRAAAEGATEHVDRKEHCDGNTQHG